MNVEFNYQGDSGMVSLQRSEMFKERGQAHLPNLRAAQAR